MFGTKDHAKLTTGRVHQLFSFASRSIMYRAGRSSRPFGQDDCKQRLEASVANKLFKVKILLVLCVAILTAVFGFWGHEVGAFIEGPPASLTGAPGEQTCLVCHASFELGSGPGTLTINGLPANYTPNQEAQVTVRLRQEDRVYYGFQITALDQSGRQAGTLIVTDPATTQPNSGVVGGNLRRYIQHTQQGAIPVVFDEREWTFRWRAPATLVGPVTFYAAGNAADGNIEPTGDYIYATSATVLDRGSTEPIQVVLSRDGSGQLQAIVTITNPLPDPVPDVTVALVRASTLDGSAFVDGVPVPQSFGTINPGQSVTATVTFPGTSGVPSGFAGLVRIDLSYTGGTYTDTKQVVTP